MRYALGMAAIFGAAAFACAGDAHDDAGADAAPDAAIDADAAAPTTCGEAEALPARATRDEAAHTLTVTCDGDAKTLAVTLYDDGIARLRYGDDARGSIVPVDRPEAKDALRTGRRGDSAVVCTNELEIAVAPGTCRVVATDVATGAVVLEDGDGGGFFRGRARARTDKGDLAEEDVLGVVRASPEGERFYGLGLHAATQPGHALDLRGSTVELWNTDAYDAAAGGFRPDAASLYESIPFYVGLRGATAYGVFTDNTHRVRVDLASSDPARVRLSAWGGAIDQYLVAGPRMRDVLRRYTLLTGRTPLPPPWALGFHQSRWEGPCDGSPAERPFCSASQIVQVAQTFRDRKIPADGIFLDIQHMDGFRSFTFDATRFPDAAALAAELDALGFRVHTIVDPGIKIDPAWDVYKAGLSGDRFLKTPAGDVFQGEVWPGPAAFPDFTAPKTRAWWSSLVQSAASKGVRGMWIDMNEPSSFTTGTVPDDVLADGDGRHVTMAEAHDAYAWFEAKATYEGLKQARPDERPFVLSRAAFAGQQRYSAVWTGDAPSTWTTLGMTLPQLLHLGMSGIAFAGSDVGGYSGRAESTPELFTRWMALGAISPFFRAHAEKDARRQEPWAFGAEVEDATRALVSLRYELMPYLYSAFEETRTTGAPVLRPLVFEFQEDPKSQTVADEAMLGPSLLAAPLLTQASSSSRAVYLPPGRWFDFRSGAVLDGGQTVTVAAAPELLPEDTLPLYAREGAIVPRAKVVQHVGEAPGAPLWLDVFPGEARSTFTLYEDDGGALGSHVTFAAERTRTPEGARLEATAPDGTYSAGHASLIVRIRRVDHDVTRVAVGGAPLTRAADPNAVPIGSYAWDAADRALVVALDGKTPFSLEAEYDTSLLPDGDVEVPIHVTLPAGTPATTPISVASSGASWTHLPLVRTGDEASGTVRAPRGGFAWFKITRGDWATVEKGGACAEVPNRHAFGAAARPVEAAVVSWADTCP
jgi:alpha-glucosidase